jgi:hypothetical protein
MNRREELIGDALRLLYERGFVPSVQENGRHIKIRWVDFGRRFTLIISRTPSDIYARKKSRATLRRLLRSPIATEKRRARHDDQP